MRMIFLMSLSYLTGSIPSAYLIVKIFFHTNIFEWGSKNGGATNVLRSFGTIPGLCVLLLDFFKGFLLLYLTRIGEPGDSQLILLLMITAAFMGHTFPVWTRFKGGKGVAVTAGCISALFPIALPFCLAVFIITIGISGYVSLASMMASLTLPVLYGIIQLLHPGKNFILTEFFFMTLMILIVIFHRKNIHRILHGQEPKWQERFKHDKEVSSQGGGD